MKFGTQQQIRTITTVTWSSINFFFKFKMAAGRYVGKYWKFHNSPGLTWTKCGWSHSILFTTSPPWCRCHGTGRCLATAHWTFSSYGHLEAERVNQFWWNLVHNSKLGPKYQLRNQILKFLKFNVADDRHVGNSLTRQPMEWLGRNLGGRIPSRSQHVRHDAVAMATSVA